MSSVGEEHSGLASGVNNAVARTAGLLAIALMGVVVSMTFRGALVARLASPQIDSAVRQQVESESSRLAGIEIPSGLPSTERDAIRVAVGDSFVSGFRLALMLAAALALASSASAELMIGGRTRATGRQPRGRVAEA